jgi:hypothetical protein
MKRDGIYVTVATKVKFKISRSLVQCGGEKEMTEKDGTAGGTNENDGNYTHG